MVHSAAAATARAREAAAVHAERRHAAERRYAAELLPRTERPSAAIFQPVDAGSPPVAIGDVPSDDEGDEVWPSLAVLAGAHMALHVAATDGTSGGEPRRSR